MTTEKRNASRIFSRLGLLGLFLAVCTGLAFTSVRPNSPGTSAEASPPPEPDPFDLGESRRGVPLFLIGVILAVASGLAILGYVVWFSEGEGAERGLLTEPVERTTIRSSIVASGSVQPVDKVSLRFSRSGRITEMLVEIGQEVQQGDALVKIDDAALRNRLATTQASLALSQANLRRLLQDPSEADITSADYSVVSAETQVARTERDLEDLLDGATAAELATAEEAVVAATAAKSRAERDLQDLLDGASEEEKMSVEQGVVTARAARDRAQRDLDALRAGPTTLEIAVGEQAVATAEAGLISAQVTYDALTTGASDADLAAAKTAIASAEFAQSSAKNAIENALSGVDSAEAGLKAAGSAYCAVQDPDPLCSPFIAPLTGADVDVLLALISDPGTNATVLGLANAIIMANVAYGMALNSVETAQASLVSTQAALDSAEQRLAALQAAPDALVVDASLAAIAAAEASLASAELRLDDLLDGPDSSDIATVQDALSSAEASLSTAEARYADLLKGASLNQITSAEDAIQSATAAVNTAIARRDDLLGGADPSAVATAQDAIRVAQANLETAVARRSDLLDGVDPEDAIVQQQQVRQAELSVRAARLDLDETTLVAPFDGTVGAIDVQVGDLATAGSGIVTLLTPGEMKVVLSVGETELARIRVGMGGGIMFDAIPGKPFIISVYAINLSPNEQQGVVTYIVDASIAGIGGDGPNPAPGMNGTVALITEQQVDVLAIQSRAIRRLGDDLVVDVLVNGLAEPRVIETGLSDGELTEVISGLEEGELVVVGIGVAGESEEPSGAPTAQDLPEGIR